jgi:hypothetical protein
MHVTRSGMRVCSGAIQIRRYAATTDLQGAVNAGAGQVG